MNRVERGKNLADPVAAIHAEMEPQFGGGSVADYIPALARVDRRLFGLAVATCDGAAAAAGANRDGSGFTRCAYGYSPNG